ncbi:MAG: alpha/beta hydrolase [Acidimicrobiia bacterium]|nr:alpha/beta hydrolase [Acidimicrobiia bacterium]
MASVQANGITIEYEEQGQGEPLLLVMGLGGQLTDWPQDFVDQLAGRGFRVIRFDNRDIGLSSELDWTPPTRAQTARHLVLRSKPPVGYIVDDMANDAAGLLDAIGVDAAHVVGMSMGGMIAQSLAIRHAHRVLSLTSVMSNTGDRKNGRMTIGVVRKALRLPEPTRENAAEVSVEMFKLFAGPHFDPDEHLARGREAVARSFRPVGTQRQAAAIAASSDRTAALAAVTAPTLVIHGLLDTLVKPSGGIATARAVPHSRLLMFPDMGHDLPQPRWSQMIDAIEDNAPRTVAVGA